MDYTKWLIGALIGGVAYFFAGWLVYGILLKDLFEGDALQATVAYPEADFKIGLMALSCLGFGALFSFIYVRWANISTFIGGAKAGAILALFISFINGMGLASSYKIFTVPHTFYDMAANAFCSAIAGGLIGWYLGRGKE